MVAKARNQEGSVMVTGRLSFPELAQPGKYGQDANSKPRYAVHLLIEKGSEEAKLIADVTNKLLQDKLGKTIKDAARLSATIQAIKADAKGCCIKDGALKAYDGYANSLVISAYNNTPGPRPTCLDKYKQVMNDPDLIAQTFYSGCYVHAILNFWVQDNKFGKALRCSCGGVMFAKDGERFSGSSVASSDDFAEIEASKDDPFGEATAAGDGGALF